jgi:1-acyl-sn-glycerol-3-phosphate acyltransferase
MEDSSLALGTATGSDARAGHPAGAAGPRPRSLSKRVWLVTCIIRLALMIAARSQIFVRVQKTGGGNVPRHGRVILAGNHPSPADPILLFGGLRRNACFLAAEFLFRKPLLGPLLRWMGHIQVDRGTDKAAEAAAKGVRVLAGDGVVVIFPSGRITRPGERYRPKTGVARMAFATGSPVVPFYLAGTDQVLRRGRPRPMRRIRMSFGEPIAVHQIDDPSPADLEALTARVIDASNRLGAPASPPADRDERSGTSLLAESSTPWPAAAGSLAAARTAPES